MRDGLIAAAAGLALLLTTVQARAAQIEVVDSRCQAVTPAILADMERKLKSKKAIDDNDTILCRTPPSQATAQKNTVQVTNVISSIAGPIMKIACVNKNSDVLEDCNKRDDATARKSCRATEKKRWARVRPAC